MDLIVPDYGLLFWTALVFVGLLFILTKFIWKPILSAVNEREKNISDALALAEKTKAEMAALQSQNENLLKEAKIERDAIVKDARETALRMVEDSAILVNSSIFASFETPAASSWDSLLVVGLSFSAAKTSAPTRTRSENDFCCGMSMNS